MYIIYNRSIDKFFAGFDHFACVRWVGGQMLNDDENKLFFFKKENKPVSFNYEHEANNAIVIIQQTLNWKDCKYDVIRTHENHFDYTMFQQIES